jgi:hypothetical protein
MPKDTTKTKATKSAKGGKDPNAPKRPLSAYMYYSQAQRNATKEAHPDATFGELGKIMGAAWKELSEEDKKVRFAASECDGARACWTRRLTSDSFYVSAVHEEG